MHLKTLQQHNSNHALALRLPALLIRELEYRQRYTTLEISKQYGKPKRVGVANRSFNPILKKKVT